VNASKFWIGEKDRPVMAPEGFVYLALARADRRAERDGQEGGSELGQEGNSIAQAGNESVSVKKRDEQATQRSWKRGYSLGNNLSSIHRKNRNQRPRRRS
jgi:hypothetical protein